MRGRLFLSRPFPFPISCFVPQVVGARRARMFASTSATFAFKGQSRAVAAQAAEADRHRFFVGTSTLREQNEVHVLEFNEETNDLHEVQLGSHPGEVWGLSPSPRDANLLFTSHNQGGEFGCTLWKLHLAAHADEGEAPGPSSPSPDKLIEPLATMPQPKGRVRSMLWSAGDEAGSAEEHVVTLDDSTLHYWALGAGHKMVKEVGSIRVTEGAGPDATAAAAAWDPHETTRVATVQGSGLAWWDLRSLKQSAKVEVAHKYGAMDVDFNPNKPFLLVTCGQDRLVKFWDSRKTSGPVKTLAGHTHWVWTVKYNRCHDQLLLSGGTDSLVNLWRVSSISSAPLIEADDPASNDTPDVKVRSFDEHEESVYGVAWSACDPFVFVSVSYDGRVVLNHVPQTEKYKILL